MTNIKHFDKKVLEILSGMHDEELESRYVEIEWFITKTQQIFLEESLIEKGLDRDFVEEIFNEGATDIVKGDIRFAKFKELIKNPELVEIAGSIRADLVSGVYDEFEKSMSEEQKRELAEYLELVKGKNEAEEYSLRIITREIESLKPYLPRIYELIKQKAGKELLDEEELNAIVTQQPVTQAGNFVDQASSNDDHLEQRIVPKLHLGGQIGEQSINN